MKALRWHGRDDVRLDEVPPPPPPGPGQVQIDVLACGICGTDVEEWRHGPFLIPVDTPHRLMGGVAPVTLGHELAGRVVATGPGVDLPAGRVLAVDGLVACGRCRQCLTGRPNLCSEVGWVGFAADGGLQPVVNVPADTTVAVPDGLPPETGALAETLSVGIRALRRGRLAPGDRVAVYGGGAVGLLALQAARAMGAGTTTLVEPLESRRALATALGADVVATPAEAADAEPADVVLECAGHPDAVSGAIAQAAPGGRVVLIGIGRGRPPLDAWDLVVREKEIIGSLSHLRAQDFTGALTMLSTSAITWQPLVERIPLSAALDQGLLALAERPTEHLKLIVTPDAVTSGNG
ncbi:MAG TPA: alcohol dehydrogenase catalytic domain-containing protein [Acidimicrobiales bacterium]|nr:alcohol dehydrogenase catalytic domain-containing protein [Acidimicrobiales bacterium]